MKKSFKVLLFYPNEPLLGIAPTNLAILSACLKNDGFDVKLFDCTIYKPKNVETNDDMRVKLGHVKKTSIDEFFTSKDIDIYEDFVKVVEDYNPDLIGFSVLDSTITFSFKFIEKIKDKNIPIIMGGVGATFAYKKILSSNLVDFVCVGEGEEALVEICNKLYKSEDCSSIRNIYLKDKDGIIIKNPIRPLINVETLPSPDFSIYEPYRFYRPFFGKVVKMMRIDTDRGCPFLCTYCTAPSLKNLYKENNGGHYYRTKSIDKIFNEIKESIEKYDIDFLSISTESFLSMPMVKFREFAERYIKEINLPFTCQTRLDTFTEEKTKLLYEMGCKSVAVGLEHGSEKIRQELLNKRLTTDHIINSFELMTKYNIYPTINNMIGLPDETRDNVFETINLNRKVFKILKGNFNFNIFTFIPFSGTKLREMCIEKGYITGDEDIPISFFKHSLLTMPTMSKEEIYGLEKTFVLYTTLPESYFSDIKIAEGDNEEGEQMFNKLMDIKNKGQWKEKN
jgi:anaerobic magnesium-protoporphyrin IX monomethyl ester cyclase